MIDNKERQEIVNNLRASVESRKSWDDVPDGDKCVMLGVIADIKRKKDKHNNQFAYLDLCINDRILETTIWSKQLKDYHDLVYKGSCVAILGRKEEDHFFVEQIKKYDRWLNDVKKKYNKR